jgi:uncharacterized protein YcfL
MDIKKILATNLAVLGAFILVGCASNKVPQHRIAPSIAQVSIPVERTKTAISRAKYALEKQDYATTKAQLVDAERQAEVVRVELDKHQLQVEEQAKELNLAIDAKNKAEERAEIKAKEAHQNAKERDVLVYLWAVFFALWLLATVGSVLDLLPPQYRIAGKVLFLLLGFGLGYAIGRYLLRWLAYLFP